MFDMVLKGGEFKNVIYIFCRELITLKKVPVEFQIQIQSNKHTHTHN